MPHPAHPLVEDEHGDTYFQSHDLEAGKRLVARDRFVRESPLADGRYVVFLCDTEEVGAEDLTKGEFPPSVAEYGFGETAEVAWRYAIGAACGPIDNEYDERRLITILQVV